MIFFDLALSKFHKSQTYKTVTRVKVTIFEQNGYD